MAVAAGNTGCNTAPTLALAAPLGRESTIEAQPSAGSARVMANERALSVLTDCRKT